MKTSTLACVVLIFCVFFSVPAAALAQVDMTPVWKYSDGGSFNRVGISGDGGYVGAGAFNTFRFYLFHGNVTVWTSSLSGRVNSISLSSDGQVIAVGTFSSNASVGVDFYVFSKDTSTPVLTYHSVFLQCVGVVTSDGKYVLAAFYGGKSNSTVVLFETGQSQPSWTWDLQGTISSVSMSQDGAYFVVTTDTGYVSVFGRGQQALLWTRSIGTYGLDAVVSGDGNYFVAIGGSQIDGADYAIYQFSRQSSDPLWQASLPAVGNSAYNTLSVSYNGSVFAVCSMPTGDAASVKLTVFDKNVAHDFLVQGQVGKTVMSSDGRFVFVVSLGRLLVCEYVGGTLELKQQYQQQEFFYDAASSSNGVYVAAAVALSKGSTEQDSVFFFDTSITNTSQPPPAQDFSILIVAAVVVVVVVLVVVFFAVRIMRHRETPVRRIQRT